MVHPAHLVCSTARNVQTSPRVQRACWATPTTPSNRLASNAHPTAYLALTPNLLQFSALSACPLTTTTKQPTVAHSVVHIAYSAHHHPYARLVQLGTSATVGWAARLVHQDAVNVHLRRFVLLAIVGTISPVRTSALSAVTIVRLAQVKMYASLARQDISWIKIVSANYVVMLVRLVLLTRLARHASGPTFWITTGRASPAQGNAPTVQPCTAAKGASPMPIYYCRAHALFVTPSSKTASPASPVLLRGKCRSRACGAWMGTISTTMAVLETAGCKLGLLSLSCFLLSPFLQPLVAISHI